MALEQFDPEIYSLLELERKRQRTALSLIASENIVSKSVREAVGSEFTNKYAEGYPNKRYYGGCEFHDDVENLAISRAKEIFKAEHVNVQPHSGSSANIAAYFSMAKYGDAILAMSLDHGGHLTHGSRVNFSGRFFNFISYGVRKDDQLIDMEEVARLALEHKPKVIVAGASAYSRIIDFSAFAKVAQSVGAYLMVDMAHIAGLVASGHHPSPIPHADMVTSTTHKTLRGPRGGLILCKEAFKKPVNSWIFPGLQGGPFMHEIAGKAVCFKEAMSKEFTDYQGRVVSNASHLAQKLKDGGLKLVSGGTDNHLILLDLSNLAITGQDAEKALDAIGIVCNKNKIPFDEKPATITSGIRLGTPSITSRGMGLGEMDEIAEIILACLNKKSSESSLRSKVQGLAERFIFEV